MKITTNNKERELLSYWQLSKRELKDFNYIERMEEDGIGRFFRYRGDCYDVSEFDIVQHTQFYKEGACENWHGYQSDTYFSGVLIRYSGDFESVIVGRYFC